MITENEARTKLCCGPLILAETWINEENIKAQGGMKTGRCIASRCMAWRWNIGMGSGQPMTTGFCGLAGRS